MSRVTKIMKSTLSNKVPVILTALIVSGCASYSKDHFTVGSVPSDYRTKHPIVVAQNEDHADMIVTRDMKGMSLRQRNVALALIGRYKRSGAKTLKVLLPAGSHNEAAARRVGTDLVRLMKEERIPANHISVSRYHASNHGDSATVRLSFVTVDAKVHSKCGEWREDLGNTSENQNYGNFGCATQNNLAEMIANPEDLVSPRGESEIDAERRDSVITDWRANGTPDLPSLL